MIAVVPASLWAADSSPAMLYAKGAAWINGGAVPRTSAVFPGDLVQTRSDSVASINASGSNVVVLADSLVKFEGPAVALEHGTLRVATSKGLSTHTGDITVAPASNGWTEFEVKQVSDGTVQIMAQKGDVTSATGQAPLPCPRDNKPRSATRGKEKEEEEKGRRRRPSHRWSRTGFSACDLRRRSSRGWTPDLGVAARQHSG